MCLITTQKTAKVADQDITVYKLMRHGEISGGLSPMFQIFDYRIGKRYDTPIVMGDRNVSYDFCCFDPAEVKWLHTLVPGAKDDWAKSPLLVSVKGGFHCATSSNRLEEHVGIFRIYECVVPKGSQYFESGNGLMAASSIIVTGKTIEP